MEHPYKFSNTYHVVMSKIRNFISRTVEQSALQTTTVHLPHIPHILAS